MKEKTANEIAESPAPSFRCHVRLLVEYDGEPFAGWQRQPHRPSVQQTLEEAVLAIAGRGIRVSTVTAAGRTDAGVHAAGQVASFFTDARLPFEKWAPALNTKLPPQIRIVESREAPPNFHPRKDATRKRYQYVVWTRATASALERRALHVPYGVDWDEVRRAAQVFVGRHDFKSFQAADATTKTSVREIYRFDVRHEPPWRVVFDLEGNGFLKQMVRTIVGTLLDVGIGKSSVSDVRACLEAKDRTRAGRTVPPWGLTLCEVRYGDG